MMNSPTSWLLSALVAASMFLPSAAQEQQTFSTPELAAKAFVQACQSDDPSRLRALLGPQGRELLDPSDPQLQREQFKHLTQAAGQRSSFEKRKDGMLVWLVGNEIWPFPIPLVRQGANWRFDTAAGKHEVLTRRIGRNELQALSMLQTLSKAEEEYASLDHKGNGVPQFTSNLMSQAGRHDGLYWETSGPTVPPSPLQSVVADYKDYLRGKTKGSGWFGYHFKILTRQGALAPAGAYSYIINGNMIGGYAILAWPIRHGNSGVMTFMLHHNGPILEKNLGADTDAIARKITEYNPDRSWRAVPPSGIIPAASAFKPRKGGH